MIRLSTKDASILARLIQYENLPVDKRREMLNDASPDAREVGLVLIGDRDGDSVSPDVGQLATAISAWVRGNRYYGKRYYSEKRSHRATPATTLA